MFDAALNTTVIAVIACVFGFLVPLAILLGRSGVKRRRQATLENLRRTLQKSTSQDVERLSSFEIALQKYNLSPPGASRRDGWEGGFIWFTALTFMILSAAGFALLIGHAAEGDPKTYRIILGAFQTFPWDDPIRQNSITNYEVMTTAVIAFSFLGAYIWSIQYLIRRIACFDLSPMSFLRVTAQIILGCASAAMLRHLVLPASGALPEWSERSVLLIAFLIGFFPNAGLSYLMEKVPQLRIKRLDPDVPAVFRAMPVEMIDGIDSHVSFRLAEREINDVENLAVENPILLCTETPYPLLEVIDWIAQAQLALEVGPRAYRGLRELGLRTIFALEKVVGDSDLEPAALRILYPQESDRPKTLTPRLAAMKSSLHVERLFQVWQVVREALCVSADEGDPGRPANAGLATTAAIVGHPMKDATKVG